MKNFKALAKGICCLLIAGAVVSCTDNDDNAVIENDTQDLLEIQRSEELDQVDNILGEIVIDVFEQEENNSAGRQVEANSMSFIPECVTITVVAQQNFREITVDFGSEGCFVQGHLLRGQMVLDYTRDPEAQEIQINYNLIDFFVDAKNVIGSRSILRELSNENGNPQFTHDLSLTVIWPNGVQASREGTKIREWVEGFGSGVFSDNVFEVTGNWTATFVNGNTHSYEVTTPLRREVGCVHFVSGTIDVQRTNFGGVFDYGDGTCDALATFTFNNGTEIEITLN